MSKKYQGGMSRRDFLRNSSLSAAAVAAGATMVGGTQVAAAQEAAAAHWSTPPEPIPADQIIETIDADVVIVGAGMSGAAAAASATENAGKVIVLEKGATFAARGLGIGTFESRLMRDAGIELDKAEVVRRWTQTTGSRAKEELIWLFVNHSGEAMDWLLDKWDAAIEYPAVLWGGYYKGPTFTEYPAYHMFFGGPLMNEGRDPAADCTAVLIDSATAGGAEFIYRSPVVQLVKEGDRVVAAIAQTEEGYKRYNAAKGVILATGDISGNDELTEELCPEANRTNRKMYYPIGQNTGDGHKMGVWAGGALQKTPFPPMLHSQALSMQQFHYLSVNTLGERFFNEDTWVQAKSLQSMRQPGGPVGYSIFDSKWPEEVAASVEIGGGMFWDSFRVLGGEWTPDYDAASLAAQIEAGETAWQADTIEELAQKAGLPAEAFTASVSRYNELAEAGVDSDFGKRAELLQPINQAPYYATKWGASVLVVVGGLSVDTKLNVLDANQQPVPGLYAVGNASGDLYTVDYPIHVPGTSHGRALTWGYLAGKNVMAE